MFRAKADASKAKPWDTRVSHLPDPICCWSCGHYLGDPCHWNVNRPNYRPCALGLGACNGYAFPGKPPCRRANGDDTQDRAPLQDHYSLVDGRIVFTHRTGGEGRVHVAVNDRCDFCGMVHEA